MAEGVRAGQNPHGSAAQPFHIAECSLNDLVVAADHIRFAALLPDGDCEAFDPGRLAHVVAIGGTRIGDLGPITVVGEGTLHSDRQARGNPRSRPQKSAPR
jgi:hypothetical protein